MNLNCFIKTLFRVLNLGKSCISCRKKGVMLYAAVSIPVMAQPLFEAMQIDNQTDWEACTTGDFTGDKVPDIICGNMLYAGPTWDKVELGFEWNSFDDFNVPVDVDQDGRLDIVMGGFGSGLHWIKNTESGVWEKNLVENINAHGGEIWDIDGDGQRLEVVTGGDGGTAWYSFAGGAHTKHVVSDEAMNWGNGAGDVNGDGRMDILRPDAWFEAPEDPINGIWIKHCLALGHLTDANPRFISEKACGTSDHTQVIWVSDVNGDSLNDIIASAGHSYGIFWYRQSRGSTGEISFEEFIIDSSFAQIHGLHMADLDGDGDKDIIAGKRVGYDGDLQYIPTSPLVLYWYENTPAAEPYWVRHELAPGEDLGAGTHVGVEDLDGDGDPDIVLTSMGGGPWVFINKLESVAVDFGAKQDKEKEGRLGKASYLVYKNGTLFVRSRGQVKGLRNLLGKKYWHLE